MKIIVGLLVLLSWWNAHAETLVQVRNRIDTFLTNHWNLVVTRENTYASNHGGNYWQGLISHSIVPSHTGAVVGDSVGDQFTLTPTDQPSSWNDALPGETWLTESWPAALTIDTYDGPLGKGWVATVYVRYSGTIYFRVKAFGPDTSYDKPWSILDAS